MERFHFLSALRSDQALGDQPSKLLIDKSDQRFINLCQQLWLPSSLGCLRRQRWRGWGGVPVLSAAEGTFTGKSKSAAEGAVECSNSALAV